MAAMLAGGAQAQATNPAAAADQAKNRQIVVEDKAKAAEAAPVVAEKAEEGKAKEAAPALTPEETKEVAKAIEGDKPVEKAAEAPAEKAAEAPVEKAVEAPAKVIEAPVLKKKVTSKVIIVEQDGVFLKVRKYSNGKYKVLGYAHGYGYDYGYEAPSYNYGHNYGGSNYYGGGY
jgi:hypothetical protein